MIEVLCLSCVGTVHTYAPLSPSTIALFICTFSSSNTSLPMMPCDEGHVRETSTLTQTFLFLSLPHDW
jgi:hypothetical protein